MRKRADNLGAEPVQAPGRVRLDQWLWAARFFKTRSLAATAVTGGKVELNGQRPKPAAAVHVGDELRVRLSPYEYVVTVRGLAARRGPAKAATQLYDEMETSRRAREQLAWQLKNAPAPFTFEEKGRPTKRDRRVIEKLRRKS